jgi:hypothetical protein
MEDQATSNPLETKPERTNLLTIICVLTFIGSGMNIISSTLIFLFFDAFKVIATEFAKTFNLPGMDMITGGPSAFFAVSALIYAGSIAGALLMWKLKKIGFHVYTTSQILLLIAPMYFFKLPGPGVMDVLLAGVFVLLYSMNLKAMS